MIHSVLQLKSVVGVQSYFSGSTWLGQIPKFFQKIDLKASLTSFSNLVICLYFQRWEVPAKVHPWLGGNYSPKTIIGRCFSFTFDFPLSADKLWKRSHVSRSPHFIFPSVLVEGTINMWAEFTDYRFHSQDYFCDLSGSHLSCPLPPPPQPHWSCQTCPSTDTNPSSTTACPSGALMDDLANRYLQLWSSLKCDNKLTHTRMHFCLIWFPQTLWVSPSQIGFVRWQGGKLKVVAPGGKNLADW